MRKNMSLGTFILFATFFFTFGCNGSGGGGSDSDNGSHVITEEESISSGGSSTEAVAEVEKAASQAVVESGASGGTLARKAGRSAALDGLLTGFNYSGSFSVDVDLDRKVAQVDLWPNLTGKINVDVTGSVSGTATSGTLNASSVQITTVTDVVYTDPQTGAKVTLKSGQSIDFSLTLTWSYTDQLNWTVDASATAFEASFKASGVTGTVSIDADLEASASLAMSSGQLTKEYLISGDWTIGLTSGQTDHTVEISAAAGADGTVEVKVDGAVVGEYSKQELEDLYDIAMETGETDAELVVDDAEAQASLDANSMAQAIQLLESYATQEIVDQSTSSQNAGNGPIVDLLTDLPFANSYDFQLDLDEEVNNVDRFPNATGTIRIQATGTLGVKTLTLNPVMVTAVTDVVLTDTENSSATATIASGSSIQYSVVITWSFTTLQTWTVNATATIDAEDFEATLTDGEETLDTTTTVSLTVRTTVDSVAGVKTVSAEVSGTWETTWTDGGKSKTVGLEIVSADEIYVTIGRIESGPYSAQELLDLFGIPVSAPDA